MPVVKPVEYDGTVCTQVPRYSLPSMEIEIGPSEPEPYEAMPG